MSKPPSEKTGSKTAKLFDLLSGKAKASDVAQEVAAQVTKEMAKQASKEVQGQLEAKREQAKERVQQLGGQLRSGLSERVQGWQLDLRQRADERLEQLMEQRPLSEEAQQTLQERRRLRLEQSYAHRAKKQLLSAASSPAENAVMRRVVACTPWAGGEATTLRYTDLLDELASGDAASEMSIHRAIWSLAQRHVLSVSAHGVVSACVLAADDFE